MKKVHENRRIASNVQRAKTRQLVNQIKNSPCIDCGLLYEPVCMDFDHLDTTTRYCMEFSQLRGSTNKILEEIKKCELVCSNCHRVRTYERKMKNKKELYEKPYIDRNRQLLRKIKNVPCLDCSKIFHFSAMDFDHIENNKIRNVATMITIKQSRLLEEIAKCEIICSNCHRIRTKSRQSA